MSKAKNKFIVTHYRLKEKPDYDTVFDTREQAMTSLLEEVIEPMSLEDAINRLIAQSSGYSYSLLGLTEQDLKDYIIKLKT